MQPMCTLTGGSIAPHGPATAEEQGGSFQELVEQGYCTADGSATAVGVFQFKEQGWRREVKVTL